MTKGHELERGPHRLSADVVLGARTRAGLFDGLAREHAEGDRNRQRRYRELGQRSRDGVGENVEVSGLTSDQAAKRNDRVETPRSREHRDRRWQLERAGDVELLDLRAIREGGLDRASRERARDLVVPARAHDRDPRAAVSVLHPCRSLPSTRHLPQSSPRMQSSPVNA
jgi:hypothetical protein